MCIPIRNRILYIYKYPLSAPYRTLDCGAHLMIDATICVVELSMYHFMACDELVYGPDGDRLIMLWLVRPER